MGQTTVSEKCGGEIINEARGPVEVYHQSLTQGGGSQLWKTHGTYTELQGEDVGNQPSVATVIRAGDSLRLVALKGR